MLYISTLETLDTIINSLVAYIKQRNLITGLLERSSIEPVKIENIESLSSVLSTLSSLVSNMNDIKTKLSINSGKISSAKEEFAQYLKENPICPLTNKPFLDSCTTFLCEVE